MNKNSTDDSTVIVEFDKPLKFTFDGKKYTGYQGDTIASALYRTGVRTFSRSFKYHRPRGLMSLDGTSPNDLVTVDGIPNMHASTTPLREKMRVRAQNAWPSLRFDLMNIFDKVGALLPVGFYYKTFIRPRFLWPLYETMLRNAAGLGKVDPNPETFKEPYFDKAYAHTEVTVVGGGPAGMVAALAAANLGADVSLIEKDDRLGGQLRISDLGMLNLDPDLGNSLDLPSSIYSSELREHLIQAAAAHPKITLYTSATAFGWYEGNLIGISQGNRLIKLRTDQLVIATGGFEQPLVFENNDLPGVFLGSGTQRLMSLYGIHPGNRAVIATTNDQGWYVAQDLLNNEVEIAMIADSRPEVPENDIISQVRSAGVPFKIGMKIVKALGWGHVRGAVLTKIDGSGEPLTLDCDLISASGGFSANNALLYQSGCNIQYDPASDDFIPVTYSPDVLGAGGAIGTRGLDASLLEGYIAGMDSATQIGYEDAGRMLTRMKTQLGETKNADRSYFNIQAPMHVPTGRSKSFLCFCEDVTDKDVLDAVGEGFDDIQTLKRYSTISMGPSQGKICTKNTIKLLAQLKQDGIAETGTTTSRPPFTPLKLGVLAGRLLDPVRLTAMHHIHTQLGASMMNAGAWKRPEHYGDPEGEVRAVRQGVGIIDVSTLGKIDLCGPDAVEFLERIYTGKFADLKPGRLRYGLMCSEEGIIFDDGVVGCQAKDHYFLTTTSGGAGSVYEWLKWWATAWGYEVHIIGQTSTFAAVNLAGPKARSLLAKLIDGDISNKAFPYMHMRQETVAGVPARVMRIGFVGELGYEIHIPAEYGVHLWNAIMDAGAEFGIRPFGVEAQRVLRLEKGHIIVGQDTNALTDPYGSKMGWAVKLDKPDFIGKPSLVRRKARAQRKQFVGFEVKDPSTVPAEGEQFLKAGQLIGRVTSARYSPTLEKSIGLGWVGTEHVKPGTPIELRTNGRKAHAFVVETPFYDPDGTLVRS